MTDDKKYNIEDFWPGAEELLDQHFQKKRGWTSNIKTIGLGLLIASIGGALGYFYFNSTSGKVESNLITQSIKNENSLNEDHRKTTNDVVLNQDDTKNIDQTNSTSKKEDLINSEFNNNEKLIVDNAPSKKSNEKIKQIKGNKSQASNKFNSTKSSNNISNSNNRTYEISKTQSSLTSKDSEGSVALNTAENLTSTLIPNSNSEIKDIDLNLKSYNSKELITLYSIRATLSNNSFLASSDLVLLEPKEIQELGSIVLPEKDKDNNKSIFIKTSVGINYVDKQLTSSKYTDYVARRKSEETAAFYSSYNFHVGVKKNRFGISTGLELNQYGEQIEYSNWLLGEVEQINPVVSYFTDSTINTIYYYLQGNEFSETNFSYFIDSTIANDTSFLKGQVNKDLSSFRSKTMLSYFEIPLILDYSIFKNSQFSISLNTGIALGILRSRRGFYLSPELNEVFNLESNDSFKKTILNGRFGADLNWMIKDNFSIFIQPNYRFNLQSSFNKSANINQRYNAIGLQLGIMKGF
jgi:hypothetical protein